MLLNPHPFTLRQLQYAVAVADTLSFREAATRCHVSQPSLSAQLAQLEEALGVRLFERDRKRVLPTAAGQRLVERARRLLLEADDLQDEARRVGNPLDGTLRIGIIPTVSPYLLPALTPLLRKQYPRLTLAWVEDKTEALTRSLEAGTLDAALLALEADVGDVERDHIAKDAFFVVAPKGHPLAARSTPVSLSELRDAKVLLLDEGHCLREQALAFCTRARAHEQEFRATSLSTLAQMVAGGAGVTLLPALAIPTESRRAELVVRPIAPPVPHRTLALVWRRSTPLAAALRQLASTLREGYPSEPRPRGADTSRASTTRR
ncbi:LysR family transcriptional regulator [Myxococcus stipitatus DSM 14675]|uniref:LysR family transcriptional regulator n=1 Tax=Myxococcus stipitatus (strain DSM 14675 / JCM 12634 / Mx s8) TaxID=1278073 RepID=L7UAB1_MYXSD|nr:LysR substrate-binding domain-containing protein [Myxococcus stipitatus]AGC44978.1 LysR family transcriptional regulator [Myxococcus stipitatus DSM 14675]